MDHKTTFDMNLNLLLQKHNNPTTGVRRSFCERGGGRRDLNIFCLICGVLSKLTTCISRCSPQAKIRKTDQNAEGFFGKIFLARAEN